MVGTLALWLELGGACLSKAEHKDKSLIEYLQSDDASERIAQLAEEVRILPGGVAILEAEA